MRTSTITGSLVLALILAACEATPTAAPDREVPGVSANSATSAESLEFAGFIHFCESGPADVFRVTPGGTVHVREGTNRNRWITDSPLVTGTENNVVDGNINLNSGTGRIHLDVTITPDDVDGTWEARQQLDIVGGLPGESRGVGHGTGDLRGMSIRYVVGAQQEGENVCSDLPIAPVSGVIVSSAASH